MDTMIALFYYNAARGESSEEVRATHLSRSIPAISLGPSFSSPPFHLSTLQEPWIPAKPSVQQAIKSSSALPLLVFTSQIPVSSFKVPLVPFVLQHVGVLWLSNGTSQHLQYNRAETLAASVAIVIINSTGIFMMVVGASIQNNGIKERRRNAMEIKDTCFLFISKRRAWTSNSIMSHSYNNERDRRRGIQSCCVIVGAISQESLYKHHHSNASLSL